MLNIGKVRGKCLFYPQDKIIKLRKYKLFSTKKMYISTLIPHIDRTFYLKRDERSYLIMHFFDSRLDLFFIFLFYYRLTGHLYIKIIILYIKIIILSET